MSDLKPCPFCGGKPLIGDCMDAFWAWCPTCDVTHETESAAINAWNTRTDSLALAAAVQAEREAIIQFAEYAERVAREKSGEHWEGRSCASFAIANFVRSRGPAPAVDVMAVVRRLVKAWDAEHKRPITDDEWVAGYREVCACIVALRALVSPTTGEAKEGGAKG